MNNNYLIIIWRYIRIITIKYLKGIGVKEFHQQFFIDFIVGDEAFNNYGNLYNYKLHLRLIKLRRKIDPEFMLGFE